MEAMRFLTFVVVVLTAIGVLALILEFLSTERYVTREATDAAKRPAAALAIAEPAPATLPLFTGTLLRLGDLPPATGVFDDALLAVVQHHVKAEQEMVHEFVHFPSIDSLYRQSGSPLRFH